MDIDPQEMKNLAISLGAPYAGGNMLAPPQPTPQAPPQRTNELGSPLPGPLAITPPQRGTIEGDQAERSRLLKTGAGEDQIYGKVTNSDFGHNHPVLGKILGGLGQGVAKLGDIGLSAVAPALAINLPGTEYHHAMQLHGLNRQIGSEEGEQEKEAQTAGLQAEVPLRQAQTAEANQNVALKEPTEITPEQAQTLGMPELAGEKVSPAVMAGLSRAHQTNTTKSDTTDATNQTRKELTGEQVAGRQAVAETNAEARQRATDAQDQTRQAVARIRGVGVGKGAGPTNNSKARGEMSETMLAQAPGILQEIDALNDKIGPAAGRWNNFWVKKGGLNDPDYAALDQDLGLYASALAVAHFGARGGGAHFIDQMKRDFSQAQSAEDLKARILHADKWLEGYEAEGKGEHVGGGAAPKEDDKKVNSAGIPVIFKGGKWQAQ